MSNTEDGDAVPSAPQHEQQQQQQQQQRMSLPHRAPPVAVKLFVGRIRQNVLEADLVKLFREFGQVLDCSIIREKGTNKHRNSAFVKMSSLASADAAIRALNGAHSFEEGATPVAVKYASGEAARLGLSTGGYDGVNQAKLFVGSIPKNTTEEELRDFFSRYGSVEEAFVMRDSAGAGRGCAFIKLQYKEEGIYAISALSGKHTFSGCSRPVNIRFAEARSQKQQGASLRAKNQQRLQQGGPRAASNINPRHIDGWSEYFTADGRPYFHNEAARITTWDRPLEFDALDARMMQEHPGPPGANIFIFNMPHDWGKADLLNAFAAFGCILSCHVSIDRQSGRNRGFGFVSYDNIHSAAAAINAMDHFQVKNKRLNVSIKRGEEQHAVSYSLAGDPHQLVERSAEVGVFPSDQQDCCMEGHCGGPRWVPGYPMQGPPSRYGKQSSS